MVSSTTTHTVILKVSMFIGMCGAMARPEGHVCEDEKGQRGLYLVQKQARQVLSAESSTREAEAPTTSYTYVKIANGGYTGWRPYITEVQLYSDTACTVSIAIPAEGGWDAAATVCDAAGCDLCSGWDNVYGVLADKGPQLAFDGSTSTAWRPQCYPCNPGAAWIKFRLSASTVVQCVKAANLGDGSGGGQSWDGGLEVSTSSDAANWQSMTRDAALSGSDMNTFAWQAPTDAPTDAPTAVPTTETPTTETPTTDAPATAVPTTEAPTTEAPTTDAPTTEAPTTKAPTTAVPTTDAPTTAISSASASGDPHMTNTRGEKFDIYESGQLEYLRASHKSATEAHNFTAK